MSENKRQGRPPKKQDAEMQQAVETVVGGANRKLRWTQQFKEDLERTPPDAPSPEAIERCVRNAGRPPKYKTAEEMQEIIVDYFRSCMAAVTDQETGEHLGYRWIKRISLGDVAIHLGMPLQRLWDYAQRDAYAETIKAAKNIVENYYEKALQENRNPAGLCFILKNGFGWRDVQDIKVEPVSPLGQSPTADDIEQIRQRYLMDGSAE